MDDVGIGTSAGKGHTLPAVDGLAALVLLDKVRVTERLGPRGNFIDRLIPGNVFPMIGAGATHLRLQQTTIVDDVLQQGSALRTKRAAVDGMIGIAFDVNHLWSNVLRAIPNGMDDDAAAHRAIRTGAARLRGAVTFEDGRL